MKAKIRTLVLHLAAAGGYAYGAARRPARFLPELAGFGFVSWGVGMLNGPAGVITLGVSLILVGSRIPRLPSDRQIDA